MQLAKRRRPRARGYVRFGRADVYPAGGVTGGLRTPPFAPPPTLRRLVSGGACAAYLSLSSSLLRAIRLVSRWPLCACRHLRVLRAFDMHVCT